MFESCSENNKYIEEDNKDVKTTTKFMRKY